MDLTQSYLYVDSPSTLHLEYVFEFSELFVLIRSYEGSDFELKSKVESIIFTKSFKTHSKCATFIRVPCDEQ